MRIHCNLMVAAALLLPLAAQASSGRAVGGLNSVLLSVRPPSARAAGLELSWTDAIPPNELVRYRILRAAAAPVGSADVAFVGCVVLVLAAAACRRRRPRVAAAVALVSTVAMAVEHQAWVPPNLVIGTSQEKRFLDPSPLPGYNTYRVVAERESLPELPSNTAGAFLGGANAWTLELADQLPAGAEATFDPSGQTAIVLTRGISGTPAAILAHLDPPGLAGVVELPGQTVDGVPPKISAAANSALVATDTSDSDQSSTQLTPIDLGTGTGANPTSLQGALVPDTGLVSAPGGEPAALLVQAAAGLARVYVLSARAEVLAAAELTGSVVSGVPPVFTSDGTRLVVVLQGQSQTRISVVSVQSGRIRSSFALPGQPLKNSPPVLAFGGGFAYLGLRRTSTTDAVVQFDPVRGTLRQTLAVDGRLRPGLGPLLSDGDAALLVPVARPGQADLLQTFTDLGAVAARSQRFMLPGELVPATPVRLSPDSRTAAALTSTSDGPSLSLLNVHTKTLLGSVTLVGELLPGLPPVFDPAGTYAATLTQDPSGIRLTSIARRGALERCESRLDGELASGLAASLAGSTGNAFVASSMSATDSRLTLVRALTPGQIVVASRSRLSGSRLSSVDFACGPSEFLLLPGSAVAAGSGP